LSPQVRSGFTPCGRPNGWGGAPWGIYSLTAIGVIAGLTHVPNVYVYASAALKSLGSDVEEAARVAGASPFQVALTVSLPLIQPALLFAAVLVFFLGFELFGLPLVLGDPEGHLVLSTYLYKLTNKLGTPSYHLMAAVAVCIVAVTFPLVLLQRYLLQNARKYATIKGKAGRMRELPLRKWKWVAAALIGLWLFVGVIVPLSGITLRAFVTNWGYGAKLSEVLTARAVPRGLGRTHTGARDLEHDPHRYRRRCDRRRLLHRDRIRHASPQRWMVALRRLPGAGAARDTRAAGRASHSSGCSCSSRRSRHCARRSSACGLRTRGLARLWDAAHFIVADASLDRTGRGRAHRRRQSRPDFAPDHATADTARADRVVAARVHDLRA
jgi:hypothetical protein